MRLDEFERLNKTGLYAEEDKEDDDAWDLNFDSYDEAYDYWENR